MKFLKTLLKPAAKADRTRSGATAIEYCLIAGIICIAIVGGATATGNATNGAFVKVEDGVWGATP